MNNNYGFIITRHVTSNLTNNYWNHCVKLLSTFYPEKKIIIIDDNSNYEYVKAEFDYKNVEIIQSEFNGRGELLPYYYFLKYKFFNNAVIIHDSVFFHNRINFDKLTGISVLPFWFFNPDKENIENTKRIIKYLKNSYLIESKLINDNILSMPFNKWFGCFGVQSYINLHFLEKLEHKYGISRLILAINCRADRCCLERIFGCLFFTEYSNILKQKSLLGNIMKYHKWGYTYNEYTNDLKKGIIPKIIVKVWTGR